MKIFTNSLYRQSIIHFEYFNGSGGFFRES